MAGEKQIRKVQLLMYSMTEYMIYDDAGKLGETNGK